MALAEPIVTMSQAQAYVRIETGEEEAVLAGLIRSASALCEAFVNQVVIARPFEGEPGSYTRTPDRHDWSLKPRQPNYLTLLREAGNKVYAVGKIRDIFAGADIDDGDEFGQGHRDSFIVVGMDCPAGGLCLW